MTNEEILWAWTTFCIRVAGKELPMNILFDDGTVVAVGFEVGARRRPLKLINGEVVRKVYLEISPDMTKQ